jgi:transcriptional regulator with XRE-family HTH domain
MGKQNTSCNFAIRVGARIESLRLERGLSVRNLAQMVECSIGHLSLMESGLSSINVCTLQKIARALQVVPFDLLNHTPENDNIGYIVEKMRQDPAALAKVKAQLKAWNVIAAGAGRACAGTGLHVPHDGESAPYRGGSKRV